MFFEILACTSQLAGVGEPRQKNQGHAE